MDGELRPPTAKVWRCPDQIDKRGATVTPTTVASFAKSTASRMLDRAVDDDEFDRRRAAFLGCEELRSDAELPDPIGYCNACGCGVNARSGLSKKLRIRRIRCPRARF